MKCAAWGLEWVGRWGRTGAQASVPAAEGPCAVPCSRAGLFRPNLVTWVLGCSFMWQQQQGWAGAGRKSIPAVDLKLLVKDTGSPTSVCTGLVWRA